MQRVDDSFIREDEIKAVFVFLIFTTLILVSMVLFFINNRRMDREHRNILMLRNEATRAIETLLLQSSNTQRALLNLAITSDSSEVRQMMRRIHNASEKSDSAISKIESEFSSMDIAEQNSIQNLKKAQEDYRAAYMAFLDILNRGDKVTANSFRVTSLRPALDNYQSRQQNVLFKMTADTIEQSNRVSERNSRNNWIFLALGSSPFIFSIVSLLYLMLKGRKL